MTSGTLTAQPTIVDRAVRLIYVCAYRVMRVYWAVARPRTHGALVAVFHEGTILLVKNSYTTYYSLPGGYVRRKETSLEAAIRELHEETGLWAKPEELTSLYDETEDWEGKRDHVEIFGLEAPVRRTVHVDRREVVEARWLPLEEALSLDLFPPIRKVIDKRLGRA